MENRIFAFAILVTIFLSTITFFSHPFEAYFHYIIFLILLPIFIVKYGFPVTPFQILALPLLFGIIQIYIGNNTVELFAKIFLGVFLSTSFYYYVFVAYEFDVEKLFALYLKGAYFVTVIGFVQWISYNLHFEPGYNYKWLFNKWGIVDDKYGGIRLNSIYSEASQFAIMISPAAFIAINNLILRKKVFYKTHQSILIIFITILTTSSLGLIGFGISIALLTVNYGKFINFMVTILALLIVVFVCYQYLPQFRDRYDSAYGLWIENKFTIDNVNSSSFILYNHLHVAVENFKQNILFGTGLGSHQIAFDKYSLTLLKEIIDVNFNKADANSMFLRLLSETGLMGVTFMLYIIFKFFVRRDYKNPDYNYWVMSNSVLVLIILYLLRQGNYFINGFPFFMWMYYYTGKSNMEKKSNLNLGG